MSRYCPESFAQLPADVGSGPVVALRVAPLPNKKLFPSRIETIRENLDLRSGGVRGVIPIANFIKRVAQKLRIIILLQLGLVTFRFHVGKT